MTLVLYGVGYADAPVLLLVLLFFGDPRGVPPHPDFIFKIGSSGFCCLVVSLCFIMFFMFYVVCVCVVYFPLGICDVCLQRVWRWLEFLLWCVRFVVSLCLRVFVQFLVRILASLLCCSLCRFCGAVEFCILSLFCRLSELADGLS